MIPNATPTARLGSKVFFREGIGMAGVSLAEEFPRDGVKIRVVRSLGFDESVLVAKTGAEGPRRGAWPVDSTEPCERRVVESLWGG
jgi:hypothetical protein